MRVCVMTTSYPRYPDDDAGVFIKRLVEALSGIGVKGTVLVPFDRDEKLSEEFRGFKIRRFKYGLFFRGKMAFGAGMLPNIKAKPWLVFQLPMLFLLFVCSAIRLKDSCDVVQANWIFAGAAACLAGLFTKKPYVLTLRGEDVSLLKKPYLRPFFAPVVRRAAFVVSVNEGFVEDVRRIYGVGESASATVANGVGFELPSPGEVERFISSNALSAKQRYILFVGTLIPRKRVEVLINLIARPALEGFKMILCGRMEERYYRNLVDLALRLGCLDRLIYKGLVSPVEIPYYFSLADFYVSASSHEGRPNAILEAFYSKVPVIASDIPQHREIIEDGINGFIFDVERLETAEKIIFKLLGDDELKGRITKVAFTSVSDQTWERCAKRYFEIFNRLIPAAPDSKQTV